MKNKALLIELITGFLLVIIFICTAPHFIKTTVLSKNQTAYDKPIPSVAHGYVLSQSFAPQYDMIERIEIMVNSSNCSKAQGYLSVHISDAGQTAVYENNIPFSELPDHGLAEVANDVKLQAAGTYSLTIEAVDAIDDGPAISYYPTALAAGTEENGSQLTYAGLPLENSVLKAVFHYSVPLSPVNYPAYCLFLLFLAAFAVELCIFHKY